MITKHLLLALSALLYATQAQGQQVDPALVPLEEEGEDPLVPLDDVEDPLVPLEDPKHHGHHHHHRKSSSSSHHHHQPQDCCGACPWEDGKRRVRVLSQIWLDNMYAAEFAKAAMLHVPDMPYALAIKCPTGCECCLDDTFAGLVHLFVTTNQTQLKLIGPVEECLRTRTLTTIVPINFYYMDLSAFASNTRLTWQWMPDCNLKLADVTLLDIRCNAHRVPTASCSTLCPL